MFVVRICPHPDHLDQVIEMIAVDKIDRSLSFGGDGLYVNLPTGEPGYLNAFVVVGIQIERLVTYRTTEPGFFHPSATQKSEDSHPTPFPFRTFQNE
jgi:hypothetical protein